MTKTEKNPKPELIEQLPETRRKLSPIRVIIAALLLIGIGYGSGYGWNWIQDTRSVALFRPWFASYVDVTAKPTYPFEQVGTTHTPHVVLSFIVSSSEEPCTPTWGNYFTLKEAGEVLDLDRRIARLQQQDGSVAVSFGGLLNDELALKCTDLDKLAQAYQAVISRYNLDTIDLDLEGEELKDADSSKRRAQALAKVQKQRRNEGKSLAIWLTLPVAPQGLTEDGTNAVTAFLTNGVDLAGVNVMTMDYGGSKEHDETMLEASQKALTETHRQLGILYSQAGIHLLPKTLWTKIGATPMIGQNDVLDEVFTIDDAKGLNLFAREKGIGRMSMWSANRDTPCGENYVDVTVVSDSCSGVTTERLSFAIVLSDQFTGNLSQNAQIITIEDPASSEEQPDDPEKSPYQIWNEDGAYLAGTKVVWKRNVYEAKWWTKGEQPDNPVLQSWQTPWQLIGPVLPGEKPIPQSTLPPGTYPQWSGHDAYDAGARILFDGIPYQAKWWTQGDSPAAAASNADSSPWIALTQKEIAKILEELDR